MDASPLSPAKAHDHTSSVMYGNVGAKSRSSTDRPRRNAVRAEPPPWSRARTYTRSSYVSVKPPHNNDSVSASAWA